MPFSEICDKFTIAQLKKQRLPNNADLDKQLEIYLKEINSRYEMINKVDSIKLFEYLEYLHFANERIFNCEYELRNAIVDTMPFEEIGRRAVIIRESNKFRVQFKNAIADLVGECIFKEVKINHASCQEQTKETSKL